MIWFSGLPQLASVALVPVIAVSLMNERRSISEHHEMQCKMQTATSALYASFEF